MTVFPAASKLLVSPHPHPHHPTPTPGFPHLAPELLSPFLKDHRCPGEYLKSYSDQDACLLHLFQAKCFNLVFLCAPHLAVLEKPTDFFLVSGF